MNDLQSLSHKPTYCMYIEVIIVSGLNKTHITHLSHRYLQLAGLVVGAMPKIIQSKPELTKMFSKYLSKYFFEANSEQHYHSMKHFRH